MAGGECGGDRLLERLGREERTATGKAPPVLMRQYAVYRLSGSPWPVLVLQSDHIRRMDTVVVAPLIASSEQVFPVGRLHPRFVVGAREFVLAVQMLSPVRKSELGEEIADLTDHFADISNALDMLFHGF
ncbi:MAG: CcdB family protein [Minwuia sp.]|uniref:CcdB family protein n=1 Tax=Minwuia sp. TaxID=2493630 RepID=UPI003A846452